MPQVGVFARNHRTYLECATQRTSTGNFGGLTTFRSSREWASAKRALNGGQGPVPVFFAVVGEPFIQFTARLEEVCLRPKSGDPDAERLLKLVPEATVDEGIWQQGQGTLYMVSDCQEVRNRFPLNKLMKAHGQTPLSNEFRYSYALVLPKPITMDQK
jgi:hypothetical protein